MSDPTATAPKAPRADAARNRERILDAARAAFADPRADVSMAEVARRAGVGSATLYRNFADRRELLRALYADEVRAVCDAARTVPGRSPGERLRAWVEAFAAFSEGKRPIARDLLDLDGSDRRVLDSGRARVTAAAEPLLRAAQRAGEVRGDLTLDQILELVVAVNSIPGDADHRAPILRVALDGLDPPRRAVSGR